MTSFVGRAVSAPGGALLVALPPPSPPAPPLLRRRVERATWRWAGTFVGRALPPDLPLADYLYILAGGSRRRLAHPDEVGADGRPIWRLTDRQARQRERLLDRLATGGWERPLPILRAPNVACNQGRSNLLQIVSGSSSATYSGGQYVAVGTGASGPGPQNTDQQLWSELARLQVSSASVSGNQALLSVIFGTSQANGTLTEAGLFGSDNTHTATATLGTGILYNHATFSYIKTSSIQLSIGVYIQLT